MTEERGKHLSFCPFAGLKKKCGNQIRGKYNGYIYISSTSFADLLELCNNIKCIVLSVNNKWLYSIEVLLVAFYRQKNKASKVVKTLEALFLYM